MLLCDATPSSLFQAFPITQYCRCLIHNKWASWTLSHFGDVWELSMTYTLLWQFAYCSMASWWQHKCWTYGDASGWSRQHGHPCHSMSLQWGGGGTKGFWLLSSSRLIGSDDSSWWYSNYGFSYSPKPCKHLTLSMFIWRDSACTLTGPGKFTSNAWDLCRQEFDENLDIHQDCPDKI